jgi:hypothetical protein
MQLQLRQKILCRGNMQTKVICNAMINSKDMVVEFWFVKYNKGNIFVFSKKK